jgi:hypothetical protein
MMGFISDYLRKQEKKERDNVAASSVDASAIDNDEDDDEAVVDIDEEEYLLAIPLDSCHELGIELESVQRAVLYRCPVLVHACIPPAAIRLPLLYVTVSNKSNSNSTTPVILGSRDEWLRQLHGIVRDAVQCVVYRAGHEESESDDTKRDVPSVQRDDGRPNLQGANQEGIRPILVAFRTLEIDGDGNQVLLTVGDATSPGGRILDALVREVQRRIEEFSSSLSSSSLSSSVTWKTRIPEDPARRPTSSSSSSSSSAAAANSKVVAFRPRVPFMRLPMDWDSYLDPTQEFLTSDQGGNGISPILWGQYMDDEFGSAARMREIGIYMSSAAAFGRGGGRQRRALLSEEAAYRVPAYAVPLPEGNAELAKVEKEFERYQEERLRTAEDRERHIVAREKQQLQPDQPIGPPGEDAVPFSHDDTGAVDGDFFNTPLDKYDSLFARTLDRLGSLYADEAPQKAEEPSSSDFDIDETETTTGTADVTDLARRMASILDESSGTSPVEPGSEDNGEADDEGARDRMKRVVESRARIRTERELLAKRKRDKPPIEENPVFAKYRNGTLVPSSATAGGGKLSSSSTGRKHMDLPPFPSDEHVVGFWRVVRSPTGFAPEEGGDPSRSDNLILRVDGTTAGGPVLDSVTRQKASGGTWKLTVLTEGDENGDGIDADSRGGGNAKSLSRRAASLRIRLVIPPQKDRILVMQGKLERISLSGSSGDGLASIPPLAPRGGTFGVPALEERAARAGQPDRQGAGVGDEEDDTLVFCSGPVFLEDAVTGANRNEIGTFTLQKLFSPSDPAQYTITIPRPVRNQD